MDNVTLNEASGVWHNAYKPHRTKNKGSIIGGKGKNALKPMKRSKLRPISAKQKERTMELQEKFKIIATEHVRLYGSPRCERGAAGLNIHQCFGDLLVDHVMTRNAHDPDKFRNLQLLCFRCNTSKGSIRVDYRPKHMVDAMKKLDETRG